MHNKTSNKRAILHVGKGPEMSPDVAGVSHEPIASNPKQCMEEPSAPANHEPVFSLEFKGLMPFHLEEVKAGLTDNIVKEGKCRDKISVWRDTEQDLLVVLDGIARLEICREKNLPLPELNYIDLPDREACREWIIDAQLNRRNLRGWWVAYFRGLKYNSQKKEAHRPNAEELHQNDGVTVGETAKRLALEAGVSEATIERNARFAQSIDQLKSDLGDEFGKKILNREFKNLFLVDINTLAEKSIEDKKAIAEALIAEPELSLEEAEHMVHPSTAGTTPAETDQNTPEIIDDEVGQQNEDSSDPDQVIKKFNIRLLGYWPTLQSIDRVNHPEHLGNVIRTLEDLIRRLRVIEANSSSS